MPVWVICGFSSIWVVLSESKQSWSCSVSWINATRVSQVSNLHGDVHFPYQDKYFKPMHIFICNDNLQKSRSKSTLNFPLFPYWNEQVSHLSVWYLTFFQRLFQNINISLIMSWSMLSSVMGIIPSSTCLFLPLLVYQSSIIFKTIRSWTNEINFNLDWIRLD